MLTVTRTVDNASSATSSTTFSEYNTLLDKTNLFFNTGGGSSGWNSQQSVDNSAVTAEAILLPEGTRQENCDLSAM